MTHIKTSVETITPETAEKWLVGNTHNRNMKVRAIEKYATDMKAGQWDLNGESLKFNGDGRLLDGQNRLAAVVRAGVSIQSVVVRGIESDSQETIDGGVPRRLADVLTLRGESSCIDLASALVRLWQYEDDPLNTRWNVGPSIHASLALLEAHPSIRVSVNASERVRKAVGLRASVGSGFHYVVSNIDSDDAEAFFDRLTTGAGLDADDPIFRLRHLLLEARVSTHRRHMRRTRVHDWALCVKAWNAYREGRKVRLLVWRPGGATPESFPFPI